MVATWDTSLRAAVVDAGEHWATSQRRLVRLVAELDASGEWTADGARTCAHWVSSAVDVELCTAREWIRVGRALLGLRVIDDAFERGDLSYSKIRTLTRVATSENEKELCALARKVPASRLTHALASWLTRNETPAETEARHHKARYYASRLDVDGMVVGSYRLPPLEAAKINGPIDALVVRRRPRSRRENASADASGPGQDECRPSVGQQRADALMALISGGGAAIATELVLHVRGDGCSLDDGTPIADSVVERIAPTAFLRALIHDAERRPINASGRRRHPSVRQGRVVKERDRGCVDCGATQFLQYDHQPDYEVTRHTIVDELQLRCWACHAARHRDQGSEQ